MAKAKAKASKKASKKNPKRAKNKSKKGKQKDTLASSVSEVMAAGLGALREAQASSSEQFDLLVERGRAFQSSGNAAAANAARDVEGAVDRVMGTVRSASESLAEGVQDQVEAVVERVLDQLGVSRREEVEKLQATVDALVARLDGKEAASPSKAAAAEVFEVRKHDDGWSVLRAGKKASVRSTKKEALLEARAQARRHTPSTLTVYNLDGSVSDTTSYGAK